MWIHRVCTAKHTTLRIRARTQQIGFGSAPDPCVQRWRGSDPCHGQPKDSGTMKHKNPYGYYTKISDNPGPPSTYFNGVTVTVPPGFSAAHSCIASSRARRQRCRTCASWGCGSGSGAKGAASSSPWRAVGCLVHAFGLQLPSEKMAGGGCEPEDMIGALGTEQSCSPHLRKDLDEQKESVGQ